MRVMAERGYEGASVQAIARAAGLTPGLVHYHFASKQEILLALVERLSAVLRVRFDARVQGASGPWARLEAFIDAHLALDDSADPASVMCWVALGAEALRQPEVCAAYEDAIRAELVQLEALVAEVLAAEGKSPAAASTLAVGLFAAIQGSYQLAITADAVPAGLAAPTVRRMARGLIATVEEA